MDVGALRELGNSELKKGNLGRAVEHYTAALAAGGSNPGLLCNRALAYIRLHRPEPARADALAALQLDPTSAKAHFRLGRALFDLRDYAEAERVLVAGASLSAGAEERKEMGQWASKARAELAARIKRQVEEEEKSKRKPVGEAEGQAATSLAGLDAARSPPAFASPDTDELGRVAAPGPARDDIYGPPSTVPGVPELLAQAEPLYQKRLYKRAGALYRSVLQADPHCAKALHRLALVCMGNEMWENAVAFLKPLVEAHPGSALFHADLGSALFELGRFAESLTQFQCQLAAIEDEAGAASSAPSRFWPAQVAVARCLYFGGNKPDGAKVISAVLGESNNECPEALFEYAGFLTENGQADGAVPILLRLLAQSFNLKRVKEALADAVRQSGVRPLLEDLPETRETSAAGLAFVASVLKENGAVEEALELYRVALRLRPTNVTYALNLVHAIEITLRLDEALRVAWDFFGVRDETGLLDRIAEFRAKHGSASSSAGADKALPPDALEELGFFFALVKVLYGAGRLTHLPALMAALDPIREGRDLHLTTIRNEHAYYSCVRELVLHHAPAAPLAEGDLPKVYVLGDSHSFPLAWRTVTLQGRAVQVVPKLVTGTKAWHLRKDGRFFTKVNFAKALTTIPAGSTVIMLFGEIDCREGFLLAVERDRYPDMETAMDVTIAHYVTVLRGLTSEQRFTVLVHPVPSVLDETRSIVTMYNERLEAAVKAIASPNILWMPFFKKLLTQDGSLLERRFALDGSHLSPIYVSELVENCV